MPILRLTDDEAVCLLHLVGIRMPGRDVVSGYNEVMAKLSDLRDSLTVSSKKKRDADRLWNAIKDYSK